MTMSARRRVAITGLGLISPLGNDVVSNWKAVIGGQSGIGSITRFDATPLPVRIAGEVRGFDPAQYIEKKEIKKMDAFVHYAVAAAQMAVDDASGALRGVDPDRVGVIFGVGFGGIGSVEETAVGFLQLGMRKVSPFFIPRVIANMAPAHVAMRFGCRGINYSVASACASGGHALGEAARMIRDGTQDLVLAGGAEAPVTPLAVGGFAAMRALSTRNHDPQRASRPFDRDRDGFVVAEGAAVLVLEPLEVARARGARVYAELVGSAATADAYHITAPEPEGRGAATCMRLALASAGLLPQEVGYINAHGTSTPYNDANETAAIKAVFGARRVAVSSTKSMTGHTLGAAGAIEAAYTALAIFHGQIPPTINYENPDPVCDLDYVPNVARNQNVKVALSNSFGFGGANSCLVLRASGEE